MAKEQKHLFEDGEKVRIKETGAFAKVDYWWFLTTAILAGTQYNIVGMPGVWFAEDELEKSSSIEAPPIIVCEGEVDKAVQVVLNAINK